MSYFYQRILLFLLLGFPIFASAQSFHIDVESHQVQLYEADQLALYSPEEGLWSIALDWEENWPANWQHVKPDSQYTSGPWQILTGKLDLPQGRMRFRDSYKKESGRIKCIRRVEWEGEETLETATLSVRWIVPKTAVQAFLPGILYHGNPSGEKNGVHKVPVFHGKAGEMAIFEEHRYPMPFASLEAIRKTGRYSGSWHTFFMQQPSLRKWAWNWIDKYS